MIQGFHDTDGDPDTVSFKEFVFLMTNNAVDLDGYDEAMRAADAKKDEVTSPRPLPRPTLTFSP